MWSGMDGREATAKRVESEAMRIARDDPDAVEAQLLLSRIGIRLERDDNGDVQLTIASSCAALAEMLRGTSWAGQVGRGGTWGRLLARVPGAKCVDTVRFASGRSRAVRLPLVWALRGLVGPDPEGDWAAWEQRAADAAG